MTVREKIKALRRDMHMTCAELAEQIGVTQATISRYENGYVRRISDEVLRKIADALNTTVHELTEDDPDYAHLHPDSFCTKKREERSAADQRLLDWFHRQTPEVQSFILNIVNTVPENR